MNHIYFYKITIQDIHVLIFLQLDWMLKGTLIFFKVSNVTLAQLCVAMSANAFKGNFQKVVFRNLRTLVFCSDNILHKTIFVISKIKLFFS